MHSTISCTVTRIKSLIITLSFILSSCSLWAQDDSFCIHPIPDSVFQFIQGRSWPKDSQLKRGDFRYLTILHVDENGKTRKGELICNKSVAADLLAIFRDLYRQQYPIHSVRLVDHYDADDQKSMEANNTSCFNYRLTTNGALSKHARGIAIDINPLWNPCIHLSGKHAGMIEPKTAKRTHIITPQDRCYRLFINHGFRWGGAWRTLKDYQHFEK